MCKCRTCSWNRRWTLYSASASDLSWTAWMALTARVAISQRRSTIPASSFCCATSIPFGRSWGSSTWALRQHWREGSKWSTTSCTRWFTRGLTKFWTRRKIRWASACCCSFQILWFETDAKLLTVSLARRKRRQIFYRDSCRRVERSRKL